MCLLILPSGSDPALGPSSHASHDTGGLRPLPLGHHPPSAIREFPCAIRRHLSAPHPHPARAMSRHDACSMAEVASSPFQSILEPGLAPPASATTTTTATAATSTVQPTTGSRRRRPEPYLTSPHGNIFYNPQAPDRRRHRTQATAEAPTTGASSTPLDRDSVFPTPLIQPRQRRPHSIHIVSYPPGFIPHDLRHDLGAQIRLSDSSSRSSNNNITHPQQQPTAPPPQSTLARDRQERAAAKETRKKKEREAKQVRKAERVLKKAEARARKQDCARRKSAASPSSLAQQRQQQQQQRQEQQKHLPVPRESRKNRVLEKIFAAFSISVSSQPEHHPIPPQSHRPRPASANASAYDDPALTRPRTRPRPTSLVVLGRSRLSQTTVPQTTAAEPSADFGLPPPSRGTTGTLPRPTSLISFARRFPQFTALDFDTATVVHEESPPAQAPLPALLVAAEHARTMTASSPVPTAHRHSLMSLSSHGSGSGGVGGGSKNNITTTLAVAAHEAAVPPNSKPIASGSGLACSIVLAEPSVFLTGFDHDGRGRGQESGPASALLRGRLRLDISKNVKIKAVTLKFAGRARTEWPEGIPPLKAELFEEETLRMQTLLFFHAVHEGIWETEYGNQCTFRLKNSGGVGTQDSPNPSTTSLYGGLGSKELKRLSLQSVQSRSFAKGDSPLASVQAHQTAAKGYKVFYPGVYEYAFELPIDHHQLETTRLQYGSVRWELAAAVERAGAFRPTLHGAREVPIVRVPDQMSLEMTEPISISRQWEDQLHYDIIISGKSFPIGGRIPIAFKLTPLAKVQVHKLKVFVTESIEYFTNDRRVTRKDPGRKILLLEKTAGRSLDRQFAASAVHVLSGGELGPERRAEARRAAQLRRTQDAARAGGIRGGAAPEPLPEPTENLLGDLDLGLESYWGSTEIEMNVQMPTCEKMARDKGVRLHPDCSWKNVNVYHWIKIVMRISRADPDDPTGKRRRHFEISIDSPFTVLNCRATQANTLLPQYGEPLTTGTGGCGGGGARQQQQQAMCGCPDAAETTTPLPPDGEAMLSLAAAQTPPPRTVDRVATNQLPAPPAAAHVHAQPRPMHLLRVPSYLPPAFDADEPPPPLTSPSPPPHYDLIVGTPSVDGLADYFSRLADYEDDPELLRHTATPLGEDEEGEVAGAVVLPGGNGGNGGTPTRPQQTGTGSRDEGNEGDFFWMGGRRDARERLRSGGGDHLDDEDSDTPEEDGGVARAHRRGRVNVANPRTPGGGRVPSRSLELQRPVAMELSLAGLSLVGVGRRGTGGAGAAT